MDAMQTFADALNAGDYQRARDAYRTLDHARTPVGTATDAMLMALTGDHAGAAAQIATCPAAQLIATIIQGERERALRWTDLRAAGELTALMQLPYLGVYTRMAMAMLQREATLIDQQIAPDVKKVPAVAGRLVYRDGKAVPFRSVVDADDAIGAMLETYGPNGLLYIPFAGLRRLTFQPARNFIDQLMPQANVELFDGGTATVVVPLLYALSTTAREPAIRAGRMTTFRYVGSARRAIGQRDFMFDGGQMVGMQNIAAIEFDAGRLAAGAQRAGVDSVRMFS